MEFSEFLAEKLKDDGLNELISIDTCSLNTVNRAFQNAENSIIWHIKKILRGMHEIFNESPSRRVDHERISSATKGDYPLFFCSICWVENANVAKKAQKIWPKLEAVIKYWSTLPKNKQAGRGDPKQRKSCQALLKNISNPLVPLQLRFFEETAVKLESFLRRSQTEKPIVPFVVSHLEAIIRELCSKIRLGDVMEDARSTRSLMKLDVTDKSIQKVILNVGFGLESDLRNLKAAKKVTDSHARNFLFELKKFLSSLCNHLLSKTPIQSQFVRCCRSINPIFMVEYPDSCRKLFDRVLEKLVASKYFTEANASMLISQKVSMLISIKPL